jgi:hypothetical protein
MNATLRRVRENHRYPETAISLSHSTYVFVALGIQRANEHAPYCHLWPVRLYNIFPRYLINGTIFGKELLNIKCGF